MTRGSRRPAVFDGDVWRACARLAVADRATAAAVRSLLPAEGGWSGEAGGPAWTAGPVFPRPETGRLAVPGPEGSSTASAAAAPWPVSGGGESAVDGPDEPGSTASPAGAGEPEPSRWLTVEGPAETVGPLPAWLEPPAGRGAEASGSRRAAAARTWTATEHSAGSGEGGWAPLLSGARVRAVLGAVTAARVPAGDIDVAEVTAAIGRGAPPRRLPRKPAWTHRRGVQLLLDTAPAMQPWLLDVAGLAAHLVSVAGPGVQTLRFAACPLRGVGPGLRPWSDYRPPRPGTPVLVVTDLGGGGPWSPRPAPAGEWVRFVQVLRAAGCRPVALVPGPLGRADPELAALLPILPWDSSATVRQARRVGR
ncbi:hypothetical protein [Frankia sp. QA3]|uniref:hypothetical protein n=1 Tax=Frankia sp. QA3 TaxID=710111 RepID=UPI000269BF21|nr:hypothetical protein [Frankia sp. QA3]EIV91490.1 hypothetical protein FraQA3DRAFT_0945 [Frankia sp. QA3]